MIIVMALLTLVAITMIFAFLSMDEFDGLKPAFVTVILTVIMWIGGMAIIDSHCPQVDIVTPIYSINSDDLDMGYTYIFLSDLSEESNIKFVDYWVKENDSFVQKSVRLNNVTFVEDNTSLIHITGNLCDDSFATAAYDDNATYEIHVPEGSVAKMYNNYKSGGLQ